MNRPAHARKNSTARKIKRSTNRHPPVETLELRRLLSAAVWAIAPNLPTALGDSTAISDSNGVFVFGGASGSSASSSVVELNPSEGLSSTSLPAIGSINGNATALTGMGVGETGFFGPTTNDGYKYSSDIFVYGGAKSGKPVNSVIDYVSSSSGSDTGTPPSMSTARAYFAHAVDPGTGDLYAIGGLTNSSQGSATASAEIYSPSSDSWTPMAPLPVALSYASAASDGAGHIFVFGGQTASGTLVSTVYRYTIASNSWDQSLSSMYAPVRDATVVYGFYGSIYVAGGKTAGGAADNFNIYNPVLDTWTAAGTLPVALYGAAGAIDYNSNLEIIGGFTSSGTAVKTVYSTPVAASTAVLPQPPAVTVDPDLDLQYNGMPQPADANAVGTDGTTPVSGSFTFTYNGSSTAPTDVGTYSVLAYFTSADSSYVDAVANGSMTIYQATPTLTISGGGTFTYNGQPHPITASDTGVDGVTPVAGTVSYTYNGISTAPTTWGAYTAVATFTSADPNYTDAAAQTNITIPDPRIPTNVTVNGTSTTSVRVAWTPVVLPTGATPTYTVLEQLWHPGVHDPRGSGGTPGYYYYVSVGSGLSGSYLDISGLSPAGWEVGYHTYEVESYDPSNSTTSQPSALVTGQPLYAPQVYSASYVATAEVGSSAQISPIFYANELPVYTLSGNPTAMTINASTGTVTFSPVPGDSGSVTAMVIATNSQGSASESVTFNIIQRPTLVITGGSFPHDGNAHPATGVAYDLDGNPIAGTFSFTYSPFEYPTIISTSPYSQVGSYNVVATFISSTPGYGGATATAVQTITASNLQTISFPGPLGTLSLDPTGTTLNVWGDYSGGGSFTQQIPVSSYTELSIASSYLGTNLTIDLSNGNPIPIDGIVYAGAGLPQANWINVVDSSTGNDTVTAYDDQLIVNGRSIVYTTTGNISFSSAGTATLDVEGGSLQIPTGTGPGLNPQDFSSISIGPGASVIVNRSSSPATRTVVSTAGLSIAGSAGGWTGTLDLGDNDLILNNTPVTGTASLVTLTDQLRSGFNNGAWNGTGIQSSAAANGPTFLTALGIMQNASATRFDGQPVDPNSILVKYAYYGDTTLDGVVDGSDYSRIDNGYLTAATGWNNGDLNYDGAVDGSDYTLIDNAFNTQDASLASMVVTTAASSKPAPLIHAGDPALLVQTQAPTVIANMAFDHILTTRKDVLDQLAMQSED